MKEFILEYWLDCIFSGVIFVVLASFKQIYHKFKVQEEKQHAVEKGIQALLRDRIVQAYYNYIDRGFITLHGLENINRMYTEYHNLGGNGTVTKLVEDLRKLEVRDR